MCSPEVPGPTGERGDDWDSHWDAFGEAASDNPANEYRLGLIVRALGDSLNSGNLLDFGSGQGALALSIAAKYPQMIIKGLEYSLSGVVKARAAAFQRGIKAEFDQRNLLTDAPPDEERCWADCAVCSEVLEHLDDPRTFLENLRPYLKPGAKLVVTVPAGPRSALDRHIGHRRHYAPANLRQLLLDAGFSVSTVRRAGFPMFNLYRLLVVARGKALVRDIDWRERSGSSVQRATALRALSVLFGHAFKLNLDHSPFGWQLVAIAIVP